MRRKKVGRMIAFAIALCMFLTSVPVTTVSAESTGTEVLQTNLLTNGGFEEIGGDNLASSWTSVGRVSMVDKQSTFMLHGDSNAPYVYQQVEGIEGGTTYVFTAKVKATNGTKPFVDIWTNGIGSQTDVYRFYNAFGTTADTWEEISLEFTTQTDITWLKLRLGFRGDAGTIYWDDMTLCKKGDTTNLVTNAGFEAAVKNNLPEGWAVEPNDILEEGIHYDVTGTVAEGANSAATIDGSLSQTVTGIAAGTIYRISGQVNKADNAAAPSLIVSWLDANGETVGTTQADCQTAVAGEWTDVAGISAAPIGAVSAVVTAGSQGTCSWDELQLIQTNMLVNGGFEIAKTAGNSTFYTVRTDDAAYLCQTVTEGIKPNTAYTVTAKAKTETAGLATFIAGYEGSTRIGYTTRNNATDGNWDTETVRATFTTSATATSFTLKMQGRGSAGTLYWDDVTFTEEGGDGTNLLKNADFEGEVTGTVPAEWYIEGTSLVHGVETTGGQLTGWTENISEGSVSTVNDEKELVLTSVSSELGFPQIYQTIEGVKPSTTYVLDVTELADHPEGAAASVGVRPRLLVYAGDAKIFDKLVGSYPNVEYLSYEFTTGVSDTAIKVILSAQNDTGNIVYDDVKVYEKGGDGTNLIVNGDFEGDVVSNIPAGWIIDANDNFKAGTNYAVTGTIPEGNKAITLVGDAAASNVTLTQTVTGFTEGTAYALTGKLNKLVDTVTPSLTLTFLDANGTAVGEALAADCSAATVGSWADISLETTAPAGAVGALITVASAGAGECRFDAVSLGAPAPAIEEEIDYEALAKEKAKEFKAMLAEEKETGTQEITIENTTGYLPPYAGQSNLFLNGDFEDNDGTTAGLANWKSSNTLWAALAVGEGYNGSDCIKFKVPEADKAQNPTFGQWVEVVGGAEYQISFKYKVTGVNVNPAVKFECWSDRDLPGASHIEGITVEVYDNELGNGAGRGNYDESQWYTHTDRFYPAVNAADVEVFVRQLANGKTNTDNSTIWIDDVELYMVNPPRTFELSTDAVFYYSDQVTDTAKGEITTTIDTGFYPDLKNAAYTFELKDPALAEGQKVLWSSTGTSTDGICSVEFPLNLLAEKERRYEVVATLYEEDGTTIIQREAQNVFVYDRVTCLGADGVYRKYDAETGTATEIFYPENGYHCNYELCDNYKKIAESGINMVQMSAFYGIDETLYMLDAAEEAGVMGFLCLYQNMKPAAHEDNIENTIKIISAVKDHPALFGYTVMDESFLVLSDPAQDLENSFRLIRSLDPNHPIMVMEVMEKYFEKAGKFVDILNIDPYAQAYTRTVGLRTTAALEAVDYKKPVYTLLEAYKTGTGRYPTVNDLRNNIWQALIAGASCVGYHSIVDSDIDPVTGVALPIWNATDGGALWNAICQFDEKEKQLAYDHFVFDKTPVFNEYRGEDYWYSSWQDGQDLYMVVLSMLEESSENTQEVSIPLSSTDGGTAIGRFQATPVTGRPATEIVGGNGTLDITLVGSEAIFYKIAAVGEESTVDVNLYVIDEESTAITDIELAGAGEYTLNQSVEVTAPIAEDYNFLGWYEAVVDGNKVTVGEAKATTLTYEFTVTADTDLVAVYAVIENIDAGNYQLGTSGKVTLNGDFTGLSGVEVNGVALSANDYSVNGASDALTLANAYLETLSAGTYTMKLIYAGGYTETTLTIAAKAEDNTGSGNGNNGSADDNNNGPSNSNVGSADSGSASDGTGDSVNVGSADNNTGDNSNIFLWMIMLAGASLIGVFVVLKGKKHNK